MIELPKLPKQISKFHIQNELTEVRAVLGVSLKILKSHNYTLKTSTLRASVTEHLTLKISNQPQTQKKARIQ